MATYETEFDLINETYVAEHLERSWGCEFLRSPRFWPVDWSVRRGDTIVSFVEIKCRKGKYTYDHINGLGGYLIDFRKMVSFRGLEDASSRPCTLVIRTSDNKVLWWQYDKSYCPNLVYSGRFDRGPDEVETQALLPLGLFRAVSDIPVMTPDDEARIKARLRAEGRVT